MPEARPVSQSSSAWMRARSRWLVGSSSSSRSGSAIRARASRARRRQPPLSARSGRSSNSAGAEKCASRAPACQDCAARASGGRPRRTASSRERSSQASGNSCATKPRRSPRARWISPDMASCVPARKRSRLDLPAPLPAISPSRSPAAMRKDRSSKSGGMARPRTVIRLMDQALTRGDPRGIAFCCQGRPRVPGEIRSGGSAPLRSGVGRKQGHGCDEGRRGAQHPSLWR